MGLSNAMPQQVRNKLHITATQAIGLAYITVLGLNTEIGEVTECDG
jgi:hypothetical protein